MAFTLGQFHAVLDLRDGSGKPYLLIGGQAVGYWASRYTIDVVSEKWLQFTSKGIDFQGGREDVVHAKDSSVS